MNLIYFYQSIPGFKISLTHPLKKVLCKKERAAPGWDTPPGQGRFPPRFPRPSLGVFWSRRESRRRLGEAVGWAGPQGGGEQQRSCRIDLNPKHSMGLSSEAAQERQTRKVGLDRTKSKRHGTQSTDLWQARVSTKVLKS